MKNITKFWDPCRETVSLELCKKCNKKTAKLLGDYEEIPPFISLKLGIMLLVFGVMVWFVYYSGLLVLNFSEETNMNIKAFSLFFYLLGVIVYIAGIKKLERISIKKIIANKNNWAFMYKECRWKWSRLKKIFPEVFNWGNHSQCIYDQIWGYNEEKPFYTAMFRYSIKHITKKETLHRTIFIFPLKKKIKSDFCLYPEKFKYFAYKYAPAEEIDTESQQFNQYFKFFYKGPKDKNILEIFKTLSPAVQVKLLEIQKKELNPVFIFRENLVLCSFHRNLITKQKTNFLLKDGIHPKDEQRIKERIQRITSLIGDITRYLD